MTQTWVSSFHKAGSQAFSLPLITNTNPLLNSSVGVAYATQLTFQNGAAPYTPSIVSQTSTNNTYSISGTKLICNSVGNVGTDSVVLQVIDANGLLSNPQVFNITASATSGVVLGTDLQGLAYYSSELPFLNLLKHGSQESGVAGWAGWGANVSSETRRVAIDADGYPLGWPQAGLTSTTLGCGSTSTLVTAPGAAYPYPFDPLGYRLKATGNGTVTVAGDAGGTQTLTISDGGTHSITFPVNPTDGGGLPLKILSSDPANRIHDVSLVRVSQAANYDAGAIFSPEFLASIAHYTSFRFMDWQATNNNLQYYSSPTNPIPANSTSVALNGTMDLADGTYTLWFNDGESRAVTAATAGGVTTFTWASGTPTLNSGGLLNQVYGPLFSSSQTIGGPAVFTTVPQQFTAGTPVTISNPPGGFNNSTTYFVLAAGLTSTTMQLGLTAGGTGVAATSSRSDCTINATPNGYAHLYISVNGTGAFANRIKPSACFWSTTLGCPLEVLVALCNQVGAHGSFTLPCTATDAYMTSFNQLLVSGAGAQTGFLQPLNGGSTTTFAGLNAPYTATIELGNEPWNGSFVQYHWQGAMGQGFWPAGPAGGGASTWVNSWLGYRTSVLADLASAAWASAPGGGFARCYPSINVHAAGRNGDGVMLPSLSLWTGPINGYSPPVYSHAIKKLTIAPYVGGGYTRQHLGTVAIAGTAGQFTCANTSQNLGVSLSVGEVVLISGTLGGTGSISGYASSTFYVISATNGTTSFTLTTQAGAALVTTAGTPTGLTYDIGDQATMLSVPTPIDDWYAAMTSTTGTVANGSKSYTASFLNDHGTTEPWYTFAVNDMTGWTTWMNNFNSAHGTALQLASYEGGQQFYAPAPSQSGAFGWQAMVQQAWLDPRMGTMYTNYINAWFSNIGKTAANTLHLFVDCAAIQSQYSWGALFSVMQPISPLQPALYPRYAAVRAITG